MGTENWRHRNVSGSHNSPRLRIEMGFEKFGKHAYVSHAKVAPIVDYLKKGELAGTKCLECDSLYFPPKVDCPKCISTKLDWVPLNENCKLITFTEMVFAPPELHK